jgi:GxxExxY protein
LFYNIIIEVKSGEDGIIDATILQMLNYLKVSGCRVGLIINFGKTRLEYKQLVM